jgi:hypothetical protein
VGQEEDAAVLLSGFVCHLFFLVMHLFFGRWKCHDGYDVQREREREADKWGAREMRLRSYYGVWSADLYLAFSVSLSLSLVCSLSRFRLNRIPGYGFAMDHSILWYLHLLGRVCSLHCAFYFLF